MWFRSLQLFHFHNHSNSQYQFHKHLNLITGNNSTGKSSVLDAIYYLCLTRSFLQAHAKDTIMHGFLFFILKGTLKQENQKEMLVSLAYRLGQKKILYLDSSPLESISSWIGTIPVVLMHSNDILCSQQGSSCLRRKMLDKFASQIQEGYLNTLMRYRKILGQRNTLLQQYGYPKNHHFNTILESWDKQLSQAGYKLIRWRQELCNQLKQTMANILQSNLTLNTTFILIYTISLHFMLIPNNSFI